MSDDRPSKLYLDRYATGELTSDEAAELEADLDPRCRTHLDAVQAAKADVPALELESLRQRAAALPEIDQDDAYGLFGARAPEPGLPSSLVEDVAVVRPANAGPWRWLAPAGLLLMAALALVWIGPRLAGPGEGPAPGTIGIRGGDGLAVYVARGDHLVAYEAGRPVGQGDVLGFQVQARGHHGVVVISVDGYGVISVMYPESGVDPEPLEGQGFVSLDGTVVLDNAPGPEVFVAVFDTPVPEAADEVRAAFGNGRHAGLLRWAETEAGVDAVAVTRR